MLRLSGWLCLQVKHLGGSFLYIGGGELRLGHSEYRAIGGLLCQWPLVSRDIHQIEFSLSLTVFLWLVGVIAAFWSWCLLIGGKSRFSLVLVTPISSNIWDQCFTVTHATFREVVFFTLLISAKKAAWWILKQPTSWFNKGKFGHRGYGRLEIIQVCTSAPRGAT